MDPQPIKPKVWQSENTWEDELRSGKLFYCQYGKPGDFVYMREPLNLDYSSGFAYYADDDKQAFNLLTGEPIKWKWKVDTLSGLYMPKIAARSFFKYEFIRVERLREISEADAYAEGYIKNSNLHNRLISARTWYARLWDQINAKRGYAWDINPWLWVIGYKPFDLKEISIPKRTSLDHPTLEDNAIKWGGHDG